MKSSLKQLLLIAFSIFLKAIGSASAIFAPTLGWFCSPKTCFSLFVLRSSLALLFGYTGWYFPTLAGSLVLSDRSRLFAGVISAVCMALFICHPVGTISWPYSLYWLIPIGLSLWPTPSIFTRALMSTYTTHAVGSVIWLYTHTTTSSYWHMLIARVWLERLQYALLLTASYYVISFCSTYLRKVAHVKTSNSFSGTTLCASYS